MDDSSPAAPAASEDRLDSWKEIAAYLRRDVTTVQRWEKREHMPVRRHLHDKMGSVYAFRSELDAWSRSRTPSAALDVEVDSPEPSQPLIASPEPPVMPRQSRPKVAWALGGAAILLGLIAAVWLLDRRDYFWRSPLDDARFQNVTDFGGGEQAGTVSRDGKFVAFLSDRDGQSDVWVTQVGARQSYNLTHGRFHGLANPSLRNLGFSPDGALVTFWTRGIEGSNPSEISVWAVPTLGGQARPYLEGAAELDWSRDGSRLVSHTPASGDPTFVGDSGQQNRGRQIFMAPPGLHAHFPLWSPTGDFIYFVQGTLQPDVQDIWRIRPTGGAAERITHHNSRVTHPILLNERTLMYLATDADGSGPWMYSIDAERRVPHRIRTGLDSYTSLAASADGRRLVATLARPHQTLWRANIADHPVTTSAATSIPLTTGRGFAPRFGSGYLLYVSANATSDSIWKIGDGAASELWSAPDSRIIGGPEIETGGHRVVFSARQRGKTLLYVVNADGTNARVVSESLALEGGPAWSPDGRSITSAADVNGTPHLFTISLEGRQASLVREYSRDPVWSPDGAYVVYSGADVGTTFPVKAATATGENYTIPTLTLTRGARRLRFLQGRRALIVMRGEIQHKNLWLVDLDTGAERQLTNLGADFNLQDFDVSPDGAELVLERMQQHSDVVLIDLARRN
jgi:Tol biopolymer transport system component